MNLAFRYLEGHEFSEYLPVLHGILYENMLCVSPCRESRREAYRVWYKNVYPALFKPARKIILMYAEHELSGFFQYYVNGSMLMMEEIQIVKVRQGSGLFRAFFTHLTGILPETLKTVCAYCEKPNLKSQQILKHLSLANVPEKNDGDFLFFEGEYQALYEAYAAKARVASSPDV